MRICYHNSYLDLLFDSTFYEIICQYFENYFENDVTQLQLYDDYISENFIADDYVYYPITLINKKEVHIHWIRWKKKAESLIDSYKKVDELECANTNVPASFKKRMNERVFYFDRRQSFPFQYDYRWEVTSKFVNNCYYEYLNYLPDKHIEQRLLDDIAYQLTQAIVALSPREGIIKEDFNFFLPSAAYTSPVYREDAQRWFFPIGIRDDFAVDLNIWVSSPNRILGGVKTLDIEICESIDETIVEECYRDIIQKGWKIPSNIIDFTPKTITEYLKSRPVKKCKAYLR